jgi:hypothetical protein
MLDVAALDLARIQFAAPLARRARWDLAFAAGSFAHA